MKIIREWDGKKNTRTSWINYYQVPGNVFLYDYFISGQTGMRVIMRACVSTASSTTPYVPTLVLV